MISTQANKAIRTYVIRHYGNLIRPCDAVLDSDSKTWVAELKSDYPTIIRDDENPKDRILKFLSLRQLGEVRITQDLAQVEAPTRDECVRGVTTLLKRWREKAENIIISTSADELAKIGMVKDALNPIVMILSDFMREGREVITDAEIRDEPRESRMRQYFQFLTQISLVQRVDEGYRYAPLFAQLRELNKKSDDFKNVLLAYIIKNHYSTIREFFRIWRFERFIHMDTCYYAPSLQAEKMLATRGESLLNRYESWYGPASRMRLRSVLDELVQVRALDRRGAFYYGQEELWQEMLAAKNELPVEISPLRA